LATGPRVCKAACHVMNLDPRVLQALDDIRPALQADGGDIELLEVLPTVVRVRLTGACHDCPARQQTLKMLVLRAVQEQAPHIVAVIAN